MLEQEKAENYINEEEGQDFETLAKEVPNEKEQPKSNKLFDILKSKTGNGTIESYQDHPLNFNNNKYIGQILRGLTGILGALDLAIIDIGMGILGLFKDRNNVSRETLEEEEDV
jgi:hypothetical protein